MAAPKLGVIRYDDGALGEPFSAAILKQRIVQGVYEWTRRSHYRDSSGKYFRIICYECNEQDCTNPRVVKLGEYRGQGSGYWQSFFKHDSTREAFHADDCHCWDNPKARGPQKPKKTYRSIESNVYIPAGVDLYEGERKHPLILELKYPSGIVDESRAWFKEEFTKWVSDKYPEHLIHIAGDEMPSVMWRGVVIKSELPRREMGWTDEEKFFITKRDFTELEYRFWYKNIDEQLIPLSVSYHQNGTKATIFLPSNNGITDYYDTGSEGTKIAAPVKGKHIRGITRDELLNTFDIICREQDIEPLHKIHNISCTLFEADRNNLFVHFKNSGQTEKWLDLEIQEIGSTSDLKTLPEGASLLDYIGINEPSQHKRIFLPGKQEKMIRIQFKGHLRFEIKSDNQMINSKLIYAEQKSNNSIDFMFSDKPLTRKEFTILIQESYPSYAPIPSQEKKARIVKKDWLDFDRFMFSLNIEKGDDSVTPQGITSRNKRLLKLLTAFGGSFVDETALETQTTNRFQEMMETEYLGIEREELDGFEVKINHKLVPLEKGWFGPKEARWKLLIDHRAWSQLKSDIDIDSDEITFLETGHRLIHIDALERYDGVELTSLSLLMRGFDTPEGHLLSMFDDGSNKDAIRKEEDTFSRLLRTSTSKQSVEYVHMGVLPENGGRFALWADNLKTSSRLQEPWSHNKEPFVITWEEGGVHGWKEGMRHLSLHRIITTGEVETSHSIYLIIRGADVPGRAVRVFHTGIFNAPPGVKHWELMTNSNQIFLVYQHLRDTVRAFTCLASRTSPATSSRHLPFEHMKWLMDKTIRTIGTVGEGSLMESLHSNSHQYIADSILLHIEKRMWTKW